MHDTANGLRGRGKGRRRVRVLFSCAGRRVELIQSFIRAARSLRITPEIHTADAEAETAAAFLADRAHHVSAIGSRGYIANLQRIVADHKIDFLVPLIDLELLQLAQAREAFAEVGCGILISSPKVVRTCRDKMATYRFLCKHGIDTPETWEPAEVLARRRHRFPYFLKPRRGSASKGNFVVRSKQDLTSLVPQVAEPIVQEFVSGIEYTLDVYTGFDGRPRCVVPRQRVEVRGGEVTKARTVKHAGIIDVGVQVVEALAECVGLITIQLILAPDGRIRVIEVNPRFGGGVPLAIKAGANFPKWLLSEWLGRSPRIGLDNFKDGLMMLRYHQSFFDVC